MEDQIRALFARNWVFWLYLHKRFPWFILIAMISVTPFVVGLLVAAILGVTQLYIGNFLAYSGPLIIAISLAAYYWFFVNFPAKMAILAPLIDISEDEFLAIAKKWADRVANRLELMVIAGIPFGLAGLSDTISLWTTTTQPWLGSPWTTSAHALFFALVYGFYYVIAMGFLLGSGIVGIAGTCMVIIDVLHMPLRLFYYRRMRAVSDLCIGVGTWALVAFAIILIASGFIKPNDDPRLIASSILLSFLASISLLVIFLLPLLPARNAIIRTKKQKLCVYEERLSQISQQVEAILREKIDAVPGPANQKERLRQLDALNKERSLISEQIKEVETIPDWPVSFGKLIQFTLTAFIPPLLGQLPDLLGSFMSSFLNANKP